MPMHQAHSGAIERPGPRRAGRCGPSMRLPQCSKAHELQAESARQNGLRRSRIETQAEGSRRAAVETDLPTGGGITTSHNARLARSGCAAGESGVTGGCATALGPAASASVFPAAGQRREGSDPAPRTDSGNRTAGRDARYQLTSQAGKANSGRSDSTVSRAKNGTRCASRSSPSMASMTASSRLACLIRAARPILTVWSSV